MARDNQKDEVEERKKAYEEGIKRHNEGGINFRDDTTYKRCRELWKEFQAGRITADQLQEYLGEDALELSEEQDIADMFGGQII